MLNGLNWISLVTYLRSLAYVKSVNLFKHLHFEPNKFTRNGNKVVCYSSPKNMEIHHAWKGHNAMDH
jgi:hypothetical protein